LFALRDIRGQIHYNEFSFGRPCDFIFELRFGRHISFIGSTAGPPDKKAAIWIGEFYLKDMGIALIRFQCHRAGQQTLVTVDLTGVFQKFDLIRWVNPRVIILESLETSAIKSLGFGILFRVKQLKELDQSPLRFTGSGSQGCRC
jgi:hypothetical protein